jgi:GDPmannose 4,6-dehydratase
LTKRALITGITGQDGSYLAEYLLEQGYDVWGLVRGQENPKLTTIRELIPDLQLVGGDLLDQGSLISALETVQPDEVYNLGAISFVPVSWTQAELTAEVTGVGVLRMLEAVRIVSGVGRVGAATGESAIRFYQASSSEMFGKVRQTPQNELTPFHPRSPYGVAKTYGHYITQNYRESYGLFAVSGILFNHESPRRGVQFLSRKVSLGAARIKLGLESELPLGNLHAQRDWGFAGDYVRAMHLMLQAPEPEDYVVGMGETHSVQELVELAFAAVDLDWRAYVRTDPRFVRPAEVDMLKADPTKARERLGWKPTVDFEELVRMMVEADLEQLQAKGA